MNTTLSDTTLIALAHDITLLHPTKWAPEDWAGVYCELANRANAAARSYNITNDERQREQYFKLASARDGMEFSEFFTVDTGLSTTIYVGNDRGDFPVRVALSNKKWRYTVLK